MNDDLISRSEVIKTLEKIDIGQFYRFVVISEIKKIPPVEQPQGEWRCICDTRHWQFTYEHYECTECHYKGESKPKYCPNCGAQMIKEVKKDEIR